MAVKGELLFTGVCEFPEGTGADAPVGGRYIDVPALGIGTEDTVKLSIINGSATESIAVNIGHMDIVRPYQRRLHVPLVATCADTLATLTTTVPHNLSVGDRVIFNGTGGGLTANLYYYVVDPSLLMTDYVFQVSATPGGAIFNIDSDTETVGFDYVESPNITVPPATGNADNTFTTLSPHGLTVGDAVISKATTDAVVVNVKYYVLAVTSALVFTLASAVRGGTVLNLTDNTVHNLQLAEQFFSLVVPWDVAVNAAETYLVAPTGLISDIVQGFVIGTGGRIRFFPDDQTYATFAVIITIRRW
jgi:hypothetical protein